MSINRSIEPQSKAVISSGYSTVTPLITAKGGHIYTFPRTELGVVEVVFYFPFGLFHQPQTGLLSAALSLALSGSKNLSAEQIQEQLEFLGVQTFQNTSVFSCNYGFRCRTEKALETFEWILENLNEAVVPEHELLNYKQVEKASLQREMQTPRFWGNRLLMTSLYPENHKMTRFRTEETIDLLNRETALDLLKSKLDLRKSIAILSGDIPDTLVKRLGEMLEKINVSELSAADIVKVKASDASLSYPLEHSTQASMFFGKIIEPSDEISIHKISLVNTVLGGFFGSRLMQEIREEKGLTYGIGSYLSSGPGNNHWFISGDLNKDSIEEAETAIRQILENMYKNPPGNEELERAKRYLCGQIRLGLDGPFSKSKRLMALFEKNYSQEHILKSVETIRAMTSDEIGEIAYNMLQPDSFNRVIAGAVK